MYKVFLADDEASMRAGIRNNIDWDHSNFILAGEAPDGEMALSLMQEIMPDILITDVRMPFMDGIELARRIKKIIPWIKIIILSGHDEFEYAKQAISLGVEEYLLKPVTSEQLMETLEEIALHIEEDRVKSRNVENLIHDAKKNRIENLLSDLLYRNITPEQAEPLADELNLSLLSDYYLIMLVELHLLSTESYHSLNSACACIARVLHDLGNNIFVSHGVDRIVCILKGSEHSALEEDAYTCAQAIKYEVERIETFAASVAIGSVVSAISEWPKSLSDANIARRYLNSINRKQIISIRDINANILEKMIDFQDSATGSKYNDIILKAQKYIHENFHSHDLSLHMVADEVNISPNHFSTIFRQETGETFINYMTNIRIGHAKVLLETTQMRTSDIGNAVGYIDTHYFSYVFKKNTGMTTKEFRAQQNS